MCALEGAAAGEEEEDDCKLIQREATSISPSPSSPLSPRETAYVSSPRHRFRVIESINRSACGFELERRCRSCRASNNSIESVPAPGPPAAAAAAALDAGPEPRECSLVARFRAALLHMLAVSCDPFGCTLSGAVRAEQSDRRKAREDGFLKPSLSSSSSIDALSPIAISKLTSSFRLSLPIPLSL